MPQTPKIFESEYRFCMILWEHEPIKSGELVKLCKEKLGWKSTTTYTVIKRLSDRGIVKNENSVVTSIVSKEQADAAEIQTVVDRSFGGSVPSFIAAFARNCHITPDEVDELQTLIDSLRKENNS